MENPIKDLRRCRCSYNGLNPQITRAVTLATDALVRIPKAVSILRNGGWELWLRNVLLIALEKKTSCTGFSEIVIRSKGEKRGGKRADLFFECNRCQKVRFVAELKANFAKQGEQKGIAEIRGGVAQLTPAITHGIASYAIHAICALTSGNEDSTLFKAQSRRASDYKHFKFENSPGDISTFQDEAVVSADATDRDCVAVLAVWVAKVRNRRSTDIAFLSRNGKLGRYQGVCCL
jgi:hypothetical protein